MIHRYIFALSIILLLLGGCTHKNSSGKTLFTKTGVYDLEPSKDSLSIQIVNEKLLLTVHIGGSEQVIEETASVYSNWSAFWDAANGELWFNSSDVGLFVFAKQDGTSEYQMTNITNESQGVLVPQEFWDTMPSSIQIAIEKNGGGPR